MHQMRKGLVIHVLFASRSCLLGVARKVGCGDVVSILAILAESEVYSNN